MSGRLDLGRAAAVLKAELLAIVRDRRAFFTAVVLPILLYPALFFLSDLMEKQSDERVAAKSHTVALALEDLPGTEAAALRARLADEELRLELVDARPEAVAAAKADEPDPGAVFAGDAAALVLARAPAEPGGRATLAVFVDGGSDDSQVAGRRVRGEARALLNDHEREVVLATLGSDPAELVEPETVDLARAEDSSGQKLGKLLPLIAVLVLVSSASFAALSAFAGEREAGTLETLLVQPVPSLTIAAGKLAAITLIGCLALAGNALSFLGSTAAGLGDLPGFGPGALGVGIARLALGLFLVFPTAVLLCAATALISARARTFREGQNLVLPLTLATAALAAPVAIDRIALDPLIAMVPVMGGALAFREALAGAVTPLSATLTLLGSSAWAVLLVWRVAGLLDAERLLRTRDVGVEVAARRVQSRRALAWGSASVVLVYVVGGRLQAASLEVGLVVTLWVLVLGLALLAVRGTAARAGETIPHALWLGAPRPAHALGALLLAPGLALWIQRFAELQSEFLPIPQMDGALFDALGRLDPWARILLLAVSPGICEELLFRGAILSGLRRDLSTGKVVFWQALLFGAVHASIYRFLPTAMVGGLLALLTLRARSLWPAVLLHATYNGLLVGGALDAPPPWLAPLPCAGMAIAGLALAAAPGRTYASTGPRDATD